MSIFPSVENLDHRILKICHKLSRFKDVDHREKVMQENLEIFCKKEKFSICREYKLEEGLGVIDFYCDGIGVELKTQGSVRSIYRQLRKYMQSEEIEAIVLLCTFPVSLPDSINGKKIVIVDLSLRFLTTHNKKRIHLEREEGTFGTLSYEPHSKVWTLDVLPHVSQTLKRVLDFIPKTKMSPFDFSHKDEICCDLEWIMVRYPLTISAEAKKFLIKSSRAHLDFVKGCDEILQAKKFSKEVKLRSDLKPRVYQKQFVSLFSKVKRVLCGDETGTGKTLQAIMAIVDGATFPVVICVTNAIQEQWYGELLKHTDLKVSNLTSGKVPKSKEGAEVYLTRYTLLAKHLDFLLAQDAEMCVFDEIQELRNDGTTKYESAETLSLYCNKVLGLSATPVYNSGSDFYNILNIIRPNLLGSKTEFSRTWCSGQMIGKQNVTDPVALRSYVMEQKVMIRRTRDEVGIHLPPLNILPYFVDHDKKEVQKHEQVLKDLALGVMNSENVLERGRLSSQLDLRAREMTGVAKANASAEFIRDLVESGRPVVVAGWHRKVWEILARELDDHAISYITGSESGPKKDKEKKRFLDGESKILFISLRSGAGVDQLQGVSSDIVFVEQDWSPAVHTQLIERVYRFRQTKTTNVYYLFSRIGSDPLMLKIHGIKQTQIRGLNDGLDGRTSPQSDQVDNSFAQVAGGKGMELAKSILGLS